MAGTASLTVRSAVRRAAARSVRAQRMLFRARWSSPSRLEPLSEWGFERGTPVDRWYIERFLDLHRPAAGGHALEVMEDMYATRLGAGSLDVVDIDRGNPLATIVGDLCDPATLRGRLFDVVVLTQTLQLLVDPCQALVNLGASLKPGGVILVTVPCVSRLAGPGDRWRWTPLGFTELVAAAGLGGDISAAGNMLACRAFLFGAAAGDIGDQLLGHHDPDFPLLVTAVLRPGR